LSNAYVAADTDARQAQAVAADERKNASKVGSL
jgi:hypothetical protein